MRTILRTFGLCVASVGLLSGGTQLFAQTNAACRWVPGIGWQCDRPQPAAPVREAHAQQQPAEEIVRVIVPHGSGSGGENRGSGVLVFGPDEQHGWVLTAEHVVGERKDVSIEFPSGQRFQGIVVASNRADDAALVRIAKPPVAPRRVADDAPPLSAEVYLAGYPAGGPYRSWATRRTRLYESGDRLEVCGHAENGTSGGPMIDAQGRVVSVISTTQRAATRAWTTSGCSTARLRNILQPKPPLVPVQKQIQRPPATPAPPEIDYDRLASLVAAKIPRPQQGASGPRGEKGDTGPPGRTGERGPAGAAGPAGKDADSAEIARLDQRIDALERALQAARSNRPAYFEIVPRGK